MDKIPQLFDLFLASLMNIGELFVIQLVVAVFVRLLYHFVDLDKVSEQITFDD